MRIEIPLAALWVWLVLGVQEPPKELKLLGEKYSVTSGTQPISAVALVTWVSKQGRPNELDLAIVWRGRPGWFMEGQGSRESGGGTSTMLQQTITRGETSLSFRFVFLSRQLTILDGPAIDLEDANVVLVDNVSDPRKTAVVMKLTIPSKLTGPGELVPPFGRSHEIFPFLQCEVEVPEPMARPVFERLCRDLRAANKGK
jgi:hypothetical protein